MSKPTDSRGITHLGVPYWVEVKGYEKIEIGYSGDFGRAICSITGEESLLGAMKHEARYWMIEGDPPTPKERAEVPWPEKKD